ncbi:MAG TPA: glycosyltransferase family 39 protein [Gemmatimonadaceae bacterium]
MREAEPVAHREIAALLGLTVIAFALRAWNLSAVGLGQYDEGVYAFSAWSLADPSAGFGLWPSQERFSPPVYFSLVSLAFRLAGAPSDTADLWVNVVLGTASVPVLWWVGRRWFGAVAALVAATILALSELHIILSRSGLTDVTFALAFLIALAAVVHALERGGLWRAVLAGVATGLAWNTKYHGWFVLVIGTGAVLGLVWFGGGRERLRTWVVSLGVAAATAGLIYLPWLLHVRSQPGSLEGWAGYFASMLSLRWPRRFMGHVAQQGYLEGPWNRVAIVLAVLIVIIVRRRLLAGRRGVALLTVAGAGAATLGGMAVTMGLAIAAIPTLLRRRTEVVPWVALGWLGLWVAAAPLYRPYFRLLLPLLFVAALLAGLAVQGMLAQATRGAGSRSVWRDAGLAVAVGVLVLVAGIWHDDASDPWRSQDGYRRGAAEISAMIGDGAPVTVVGEPAVAFYLRTLGHPVFGDITQPEMLDTLTPPRFVVAGVYARRTPALREALAAPAAGLRWLGHIHVEPTEIRLLDDLPASEARRYRQSPDSTFGLDLYAFGQADRLP